MYEAMILKQTGHCGPVAEVMPDNSSLCSPVALSREGNDSINSEDVVLFALSQYTVNASVRALKE